MYKKTIGLVITFVAMAMLTACVEPDISANKYNNQQDSQNWAEQSSKEDIDTSDLDENLSEPETMITENAQENKVARIAFPAFEYNRLARTGKGTVKGSIYLKNAYGKQILGADTRLYLNPITSYSEQWYNQSYLAGYKMTKADSRLFNYLKFTASDSNGKFAFHNVPSGRYYLIGTVKCGVECGYDTNKNIRIARQVSIQGNQILEKDLTRMLD